MSAPPPPVVPEVEQLRRELHAEEFLARQYRDAAARTRQEAADAAETTAQKAERAATLASMADKCAARCNDLRARLARLEPA